MLEATVQSTISCSPVEKKFNCRRCKGSFSASSFANRSLLCSSCLELKESQRKRVGRPKRKLRFSKSIWISKSSRSTLAHNSCNSKRKRKLKPQDQHLRNHAYEKGGLAEGTEGAYYANGKGDGIICYHCNQEVSPSQFEAPADGRELVLCDGCPRAFHKGEAQMICLY